MPDQGIVQVSDHLFYRIFPEVLTDQRQGHVGQDVRAAEFDTVFRHGVHRRPRFDRKYRFPFEPFPDELEFIREVVDVYDQMPGFGNTVPVQQLLVDR